MNISKIFNSIQLTKYKFFKRIIDLFAFFHIRMYLILIFGFILLNWLFTYIINVNVSQDLVVLHYNVDFGVNLIGNVNQIYIIPFLGTIVLLVNLFLLIYTFGQSYNTETHNASDSLKTAKFITHILLSTALLVNGILFVSLVLIYLVNFII